MVSSRCVPPLAWSSVGVCAYVFASLTLRALYLQRSPFPNAKLAVMFTYYVAQIAIGLSATHGVLKGPKTAPPPKQDDKDE